VSNPRVQYPAQRKTHILTVRFFENASWVKIDKFLDEADPATYDAVVIPGGAWNPDSLRNDPKVLEFVKTVYDAGRVTAAICHGPLVFVNAGIIKGKKATSYWNVQIDIKNAGAEVSDEAVVVDGNMITSRFPYDLPQFVRAIEKSLTEK
jgi:protease I